MGVVVKRYIDFFILLNPTPLVCAHFLQQHTYFLFIINPLRACAARVTVVVLCVCLCVCLSAPFRPLRVKVSPENDNNASSRQDKENKTGDFLKNAPFKSYGVICSLCRRSAVL